MMSYNVYFSQIKQIHLKTNQYVCQSNPQMSCMQENFVKQHLYRENYAQQLKVAIVLTGKDWDSWRHYYP